MIFIVRMVVSLVGGGLYLLGGFAGAQGTVTVEDLPGISSVNKG
jgi:hypothetical protein